MSRMTFDEREFQGGIITPSGRQYTGYLLLRFGKNQDWKLVKRWLRSIADQITSVYDQKEQRREKSHNCYATHLNFAIAPNAFGRWKLGTFSINYSKRPFNIKALLYDSSEDVINNEMEFDSASHFLFIIGNDDNDLVGIKKDELLDGLYAIGAAPKSSCFQVVERREPKQFADSLDFAEGMGNPSRDAIPDLVINHHNVIGPFTYLVIANFRIFPNQFDEKLDIWLRRIYPGFSDLEQVVKNQLRKNIGAQMMGRFQNGSSLYRDSEIISDQDFKDDDNGVICPLFSHVRRMRTSNQPFEQIVRRGARYHIDLGNRIIKGLLFVSYQKDIDSQFVPYLKGFKKGGDMIVYPEGVRDAKASYRLSPLRSDFEVEYSDFENFKPYATRFTDVLSSLSLIIPSKRFVKHIGTDRLYKSSKENNLIL